MELNSLMDEEQQQLLDTSLLSSTQDVVSSTVDPTTQAKLVKLFTESLASYDNIRVFQETSQPQMQQKKQYDTIRQAMIGFIQKRPSDELLLHEPEYVFERKQRVLVNLVCEIKRIQQLIPKGNGHFDYQAHFQKTGTKCKQHMKIVVQRLGQAGLFERNPAGILTILLCAYCDILERYKRTLMQSDSRLRENPDKQGISVKDISKLGKRGNRITNLWSDEKIILQKKRNELDQIDLQVAKIVIACERINYYTAGIIMPRDQDLAVITYSMPAVYDIQSCMQLQSLIKSQIERVEQIERQICMVPADDDTAEDEFLIGQRQRQNTLRMSRATQYFDLAQKPGIKEKQKYRESLADIRNQKYARAVERGQQIWNEFLENQPSHARLQDCKANLHIRLKSLCEEFLMHNLHITLQLVTSSPDGFHSEAVEIQDTAQSWYFTEIPFIQDIVANELALIVKVTQHTSIPVDKLKQRQRINTNSDEPMDIKVCLAYKVINLSFMFFDERLTDGKPTCDAEPLRFYAHDHTKLNLEQDWSKVLAESKDLKLQVNENITKMLNMKLHYCFLSSDEKSLLAMRLDQAQTIRRRDFQSQMVYRDDLPPQDPSRLLNTEMSKFNCNLLLKNDNLNELSLYVDTCLIDKSKITSQLYRLQTFLVYHDSTSQNQASNHKFNACFYENFGDHQNTMQFKESYQSQVCTIAKGGKVHFKTNFHLHLPVTHKMSDLANLKLIFILYLAKESVSQQIESKTKEKITEHIFLDEKGREKFIFIPYFYGRLPLVNNFGRLLEYPKNKITLPLMGYKYGKSLHQQLDLPLEQSPGVSLSLEYSLLSQHLTQNEVLANCLEQQAKTNLFQFVQRVENDDLLIYQTRILSCLLWNLNSDDAKKSEDALKAIVCVFERYQTPVMAPYRQLIDNFTDRWKSDRMTESKILAKLLEKLESIPTEIETQLNQPIDVDCTFQIKEVATYLKHLPSFLQLTCKLFAGEFKAKYARIREVASQNFRKFLHADLTQYRDDLIDTSLTPTHEMCSKPAIIVQQLLTSYEQINLNIAKRDEQPLEQQKDDSDDSLIAQDNLLSQSQRPPSKSIIKTQLNELYREIQALQEFQVKFCTRLRRLILRVSSILHRSPTTEDLTGLGSKVRRAIHLIAEQDKLRAKLDLLEKEQKKNPSQACAKKITDLKQIEAELVQEISRLMPTVIQPIFERLNELLTQSEKRYMTLIDRRKLLKQIFWQNLLKVITVCINFIDRKFVLSLFDDQFLLKKVDTFLDNFVDSIVPEFDTVTKYYSPFNKLLLQKVTPQNTKHLLVEDENGDFNETFKSKIELASQHMKNLRKLEHSQTELQVQDKVRMLSQIVSSDIFILFPSDFQSAFDSDSVQEILAANISYSVYHHLKQLQRSKKNQKLSSELQYLFLFHMSEFEKKFSEFTSQLQQRELVVRSPLTRQENNAGENDELFSIAQLQGSYRVQANNDEDEEDEDLAAAAGKQSKLSVAADDNAAVGNEVSSGNPASANNQAFTMALGATQPDHSVQDLRTFFQQGIDRRLCYFLNEVENTLSKFNELKQGVQDLQVPEVREMKAQYISLFEVLCIQNLSNLSQTAFRRLYSNRPGCLDRLVSQVRTLLSLKIEFTQDEFFLKVRKFLVVSQFCTLVTDLLCEERSRKYIAELQDIYTYKSIISQLWLLSKQLQVQQIDLQSQDSQHRQMQEANRSFFESESRLFLQDVKLNHAQRLWNAFKEMGDIILPSQGIDLFEGIKYKIASLLTQDMDDRSLTTVRREKLEFLLKPLAQFVVQLDELTFRNKQALSYRCFVHVEEFIQSISQFNYTKKILSNNELAKEWEEILLEKKRTTLNYFVAQYEEAQQETKDLQFREALSERLAEVKQLRTLYLCVCEYEPTENRKETKLLAQLIQYYKLMLLLQRKQQHTSFLNNIRQKYASMVTKINAKLEDAYNEELELESKGELVCEKQKTQYVNQMKEVAAFMHVENYYTYRQAMQSVDLLNKTSSQLLSTLIEQAVKKLVPSEESNNQFYDVALDLMQKKRHAEEESYQFDAVAKTLERQKELYENFDKKFESRTEYCRYYRVQIEPFLPIEMQEPGRIFVYRTPPGYTLDFLKHDLALLTGHTEVRYSKQCDVKVLKPFTSDIRQMYSIPAVTPEISETPEEIACPPKYKQYFHLNFKKQFYVEQCPVEEPAQFDEQYILTVYETEKAFPTMTMVQEVVRCITEKKVPRVQIQLWDVKQVLKEITQVMRPILKTQANQTNQEQQQKAAEEQKAEERYQQELENQHESAITMVKKYLTNDDVSGGLPKILQLFFSKQKAKEFKELQDLRLTRLYLELFKGLEQWLMELAKVIEKFLRENESGELGELYSLAKTRLEERKAVMRETKELYELNLLQENF